MTGVKKVRMTHPELPGQSVSTNPRTARGLRRSGWVVDEVDTGPEQEPTEQSPAVSGTDVTETPPTAPGPSQIRPASRRGADTTAPANGKE